MVLDAPGTPLRLDPDVPEREPGPGEALVAVHACGVCRTDLHIFDGELTGEPLPADPRPPDRRRRCSRPATAPRSSPARGSASRGSDGRAATCRYCTTGRENLCVRARFTGLDIDGGYATRVTADARFCFPLPDGYGDLEAAPLLCAGLIGHRALRMCGDAERLGLYGFGASAHIVCQVARHQGRRVFAFTRAGDDGVAGVRARARLRVGGRRDGPGAGGARRRDRLRSGRRARPGRAARARARRRRRLRRDPHERHPVVPLRRPLARARRSARSRTSRATTRASCSTSPRACPCART